MKAMIRQFVLGWLKPLATYHEYDESPVAGYLGYVTLPLVGTVAFMQDDYRLTFSW